MTVHQSHETLPSIPNGLNLPVEWLIFSLDESLLSNCRLIQLAEDPLFFSAILGGKSAKSQLWGHFQTAYASTVTARCHHG
jgi:hypothetical protein